MNTFRSNTAVVSPMKKFHPSLRAAVAVCSSVLFLLVAAPEARAQATANPPGKIAYQGFLTDVNGTPLGNTTPTNIPMVFRILSASSGGNLLWSSQQTVTLDKGHFSVLLGEGSQFSSEPFSPDLSAVFTGKDASDRYLEMSLGSPLTPISPRIQFLPGPYALLARSANQILDSKGTAVLTSANGTLSLLGTVTGNGSGLTNLTGGSLTAGSVGVAQLGTNSVNGSKIVDGSISDAKLGTIATQGKVADSALSANIATRSTPQTFRSSFNAPQVFNSLDVNTATELQVMLNGLDGVLNALKLGVEVFGEGTGFGNGSGLANGDGYIMAPAGKKLHILPAKGVPGISLDSSGRVSIGFLSPAFMLTVTGDAGKPGGGSWSNFSDRRIKKNISTITNALEQISRLRGVNFEWKNPEDHANQQGLQGGFIAQEIEAVFPNWVSPVDAAAHDKSLTEDGKVRSVSLPFEFDAVLVEAVKELKTRLQARDAEVAELRADVARLQQERKTLGATVASLETQDQLREARLQRLERLVAEPAGHTVVVNK